MNEDQISEALGNIPGLETIYLNPEPTEPTENDRRLLVHEINSRLPEEAKERYAALVAEYGEEDVFDTKALEEYFVATSFAAPFVFVRRKSDNKEGTLIFAHSPRFYFGWKEN